MGVSRRWLIKTAGTSVLAGTALPTMSDIPAECSAGPGAPGLDYGKAPYDFLKKTDPSGFETCRKILLKNFLYGVTYKKQVNANVVEAVATKAYNERLKLKHAADYFPSRLRKWIVVNDHAFICGQLISFYSKYTDPTEDHYNQAVTNLSDAVSSASCKEFIVGGAYVLPKRMSIGSKEIDEACPLC